MHIFFFKFHYTGEGTEPPHQTQPNHFSKLNFVSEILNFTMKINAYQEGTKINTENARHELVGHKNAAPCCRGGKYET